MGTTSQYALPYPELTDPPDGAGQIKALATAIDNLLKAGFIIPNGDLTVGLSTAGNSRMFKSTRDVSGVIHETRTGCIGQASQLAHYVGGALAAQLSLWNTGMLQVSVGSVTRNVPFAFYANSYTQTFAAEPFKQTAVTFPANRFTAVPVAVVSSAYSTMFGYSHSTRTATGITIGQRMWNNSNVTGDYPVDLVAIQMTVSAGPGREAPPQLPKAGPGEIAATCTCHTDGCENADIAIPMHLPDLDTSVVCGVCSQPITDVIPAT